MARKKNTVEADEMVEDVTKNSVSVKDKNELPELTDSDEIAVVSLIPHVMYKDNRTNDIYDWEESGQVEYMDFGTIKNMWRNNKAYFRNMWLKPDDERVIKKFGLTKMYDNYGFLMDKENYTKENISRICDLITETPMGMRYAIAGKIMEMVSREEITNISIIRRLGNKLGIDLI